MLVYTDFYNLGFQFMEKSLVLMEDVICEKKKKYWENKYKLGECLLYLLQKGGKRLIFPAEEHNQ